MTTPPFTAAAPTPLEDLSETSFGAVVVEDGRGRIFVLKKDATHNWGLWEQAEDKLQERVVPIPGGKDEADASMLIYDNKIVVYLASRLDDGSRPAQFCEITAPGVRRQPSLAHVDAIYREMKAMRARIDAVERALGSVGEAALEGRVVALENVRAKVREALGE